MSEANPVNKSDEHSKSKRESDTPYNYWRKILTQTIQAILHLPNGIWFILACIAAPPIAYFMSTPKIAVLCFAAIVIIGVAIFVFIAFGQIDKDEQDKLKPPDAPIEPLVLTPKDFPPPERPLTPPQEQTPMSTNSENVGQTGEGNVNAPNNQGNINTGKVDGNLTQIIGTPSRRLSVEQMADLTNAVRPYAGHCGNIMFNLPMNGEEPAALASQIQRALRAADIGSGIMYNGWAGHPEGLVITVRDGNAVPPIAVVIASSLEKYRLKVQRNQNLEWPIKDSDKVEINVYFNPSEP